MLGSLWADATRPLTLDRTTISDLWVYQQRKSLMLLVRITSVTRIRDPVRESVPRKRDPNVLVCVNAAHIQGFLRRW